MLGQGKIDKVIRLLCDLNLLSHREKYSWQVRLSTTFSFLIYVSDMDFFQVKLNFRNSLLNEYLSLQLAHRVFQTQVPEPYGLFTIDGDDLLITKGITHRPMSRTYGDLSKEACHYFIEYFAKYLSYFQMSVYDDGYLEAFTGSGDDYQATLSEMKTLPSVSQHGDFAFTNIGLTRNNIVVFDWEDFGNTTLPLYDLTVFLCSLFDFSIPAIYKSLYSPNMRIYQVINNVLKTYNLNIDTYVRWLPAYLHLFSVMKARLGYDPILVALVSQSCQKAKNYLQKGGKVCEI